MKQLASILRLDLSESLRSRWFLVYSLVFFGLIGGVFASGVADSRVSGFAGLTRLLLVFIQACGIILPIFILVSTVRTIAKDREEGTFEYMLSFPVPLAHYYWGKVLGRLAVTVLPLLAAMAFVVCVCLVCGSAIPWNVVALYTALLASLSVTFLGIGFLISSACRSQEAGLGLALFVWLSCIALIDIALLGLMIRSAMPDSAVFTVAMLNPVQVFRVASISLFDPSLSVIGPVAWTILETVGQAGFIAYSILYLLAAGFASMAIGYAFFRHGDLV